MQTALLYSAGLFFSCVLIQIIVWRSLPLRNQPVRLLTIFFVLPALASLGLLLSSRAMLAVFSDAFWPTWGLACLLHSSVSLAYSFLFAGIAGYSPSIAILQRVDASMPRGLKRSELAPGWFTDRNLSGLRHQNLAGSGLILESAGVLRLRFPGFVVARCFLTFRRFLGLPDIAKG